MNSMKTIICILILSQTLIFAQWEKRTNGLPDDLFGLAIDACDSNTAVISVRLVGPEKIYLTTDAGNNWKDISPFTEDFDEATDISMIDKNNIWVVTNGLDSARILYSTDQGNTWSVQFKDTSLTKYFNYIEMFDSTNGIVMGDGTADTQIPLFLKTTDGGQTWNSVTDTAIGGYANDSWRRLDFVSTDIGYFNESGIDSYSRIFKTNNGCKDWTMIDYPLGAYCLKFYNEQIGLVHGVNLSTRKSGIHRTLDGGNTWESFDDEKFFIGNDFEFISNDPLQVWYVDGGGLFSSLDTARTWLKYDDGFNEFNGRDIVFTDERHGWILGHSGNLLYTNNNGGIITDVEKIENEEIPNEIAILVDELKSARNYEVAFDATNLSSGVYYYQLSAGNFIKTNKMILLK